MARSLHVCLLLASITIFSVIFVSLNSPKKISHRASSYLLPSDPICDLYSLPGYFKLNRQEPLLSSWQTYNSTPLPCAPSPNILFHLANYTHQIYGSPHKPSPVLPTPEPTQEEQEQEKEEQVDQEEYGQDSIIADDNLDVDELAPAENENENENPAFEQDTEMNKRRKRRPSLTPRQIPPTETSSSPTTSTSPSPSTLPKPPIPQVLEPLINQTILLIGDSVDRNSLQQASEILNVPYHITQYLDPSNETIPGDWDPRNVPHIMHIPHLNLTWVSVFFYGLDDIDEFSAQNDWHYPGLAEERVDKLFAPMAKLLPHPPSFILLHSGLWDFAFFGRRDRLMDQSLDEPLSHDRVQWYLYRWRILVDRVKTHWPYTPTWIRKVHRVGEQFWASHDWSPGVHMGEGFVNFFTNIRAVQIRDMEEVIANEYNLPVFDFGHLWEGWQHLQDKVHPLLFPGGTIFNQALLHYVWMETQGRHKWMDAKSKRMRPYPDIEQPPSGHSSVYDNSTTAFMQTTTSTSPSLSFTDYPLQP